MYLLVIGNPEQAKELLKTNRDIKIGDKLKGDAIMISKLAVHKDTFEIGGVEKKKPVAKKASHKSKKNKALKKGNKFKSKA